MVFVLSYIGIALVTFASFYLLIPAVTFCSTGFLCYVAALVGLWLIPLFFMDKIKTALTGLIIPGILLALVVLITIYGQKLRLCPCSTCPNRHCEIHAYYRFRPPDGSING